MQARHYLAQNSIGNLTFLLSESLEIPDFVSAACRELEAASLPFVLLKT